MTCCCHPIRALRVPSGCCGCGRPAAGVAGLPRRLAGHDEHYVVLYRSPGGASGSVFARVRLV